MNLGEKLKQRIIRDNADFADRRIAYEEACRKVDELNRKQVSTFVEKCKQRIEEDINDNVEIKTITMPVHDAFQNYNPKAFKYNDILETLYNWGLDNGLAINFVADEQHCDGKPIRFYLTVQPLAWI